jgi:hypothetical protein
MYKNHLIAAAFELGLLEKDTYGYGLTDTHITKDGEDVLEITVELENICKLIEKKREVRLTRDSFLSQSDWAVLPDALLDSPELKQAVIEYRQVLRDLPNSITDPEQVVEFPKNPLVHGVPLS